MRVGLVFLASLVALVVLGVGDVAYAASQVHMGYSGGVFRSSDQEAVYVRSLTAHPGDRVVVEPDLSGEAFANHLATVDFLILPGGDGYRLLDGTPPRATYYALQGTSTQTCCPHGAIAWERPDDALAHREPATAPTNGTDFNITVALANDRPERLDLAWVYHWAPNATKPASPAERAAFDERLEASMGQRVAFLPTGDPGYPTVIASQAVPVHALLTGLSALAALLAAGALGLWALRATRPAREEPGGGAAPLVAAYEAAGRSLRAVRDVMVGGLVVLAAIAVHVALLGGPLAVLAPYDAAGIASTPRLALKIAIWLLYAAVGASWVLVVWRVQRALRRWRARAASPGPFDE